VTGEYEALTPGQKTILHAEMRVAAELLERIGSFYCHDYNPDAEHQSWSAQGLRAEADYLEKA